ncbi:uncharacterized protein LOC119723410 [Patiria miniata]|uniref:Uncharacterized protein n=1 Tax=Patiria miniata TaxID=46514 RepID=A0A913ZDV0_PATMI|nr:uncharacterized protein LOC119723410 [Patiria miniata]
MITCLVVVTIEILHIATPWLKEKLAGSPEPTAEHTEPEPKPTAPKVGKLRLTNHHHLLLDTQICRHQINQSVRTTEKTMVYASAVEAESAEIERQLAKERRQVAKEKGDLEAGMNKEKAAVVTKIDAAQGYINENLAPQHSRLQAQFRQIQNENSLQVDEYDGLKQSIENSKVLEDGYRKQIAGMEKMFKAKSAHQVSEKAAINKEQKDLTTEINKLEKQISSLTSFRLQALKLEELNMNNETAELKRAAHNYKVNGVPRGQLIAAVCLYYGAQLTAFVFAAIMLVFNIAIVSAAFKLDLLDQLIANII